MRTILRFTIYLLLLYVIGVSCSSERKEVASTEAANQKPLNPNGDSELALLMRAMFDEAVLIKGQLDNDSPLSFSLDYKKMLTAQATEPEKAASTEYHAYANAYLQAIDNLEAASLDERLGLYNHMVNNCMTCHQALCPGPMSRIKKLQ